MWKNRDISKLTIFTAFLFLGLFTIAAVTRTAIHESIPIGTVQLWPSATAPAGYFNCDGTSLVRTAQPALFSVLGTTYGAIDGSHFSLPDFRGVFAKGAGTTSRASGKDAAGNFYTATLGSYYQDQMQGHFHGLTDPGHLHAPLAPSTWFLVDGLLTAYIPVEGNTFRSAATTANTVTGVKIISPTADATHETPRTSFTTEGQSVAINYIIKYKYTETQYMRE